MSHADAHRALAGLCDDLDADGIDILETRDVGTTVDGDVAHVTLVLELPLDEAVESGDVESAPSNPYEPTDFGHYSDVDVVESTYGNHTRFPIPSVVAEYIDADRGHFRSRDGRVELVPGSGPDDCIDYKLEQGVAAQNGSVMELLDVVPGDKIRYKPDGDIVVLEAERIADRSQTCALALSEDECTDVRWEVVETLDDEGECSLHDLTQITMRSDASVSSHLNALEDEGYVERRPDPDDGRRTLYQLTNDAYQSVGDDDETDKEREQLEAVFG